MLVCLAFVLKLVQIQSNISFIEITELIFPTAEAPVRT